MKRALIVVAVALATTMSTFAQSGASKRPASPAKAYTPPRTPWGDPQLEGVYSNDDETGVPFERPAQFEGRRLEDVKPEELAALNRERTEQFRRGTIDAGPEFAGGIRPPTELIFDSLVRNNSTAWLVVDPPDGRVPPLTDAARQRRASDAYNRPTSDAAAREDDPGFEGPNAYDDPEIRPLAERCLVGFSSTSGPPILPTYFYNNLHQIVQTRDTVMILTEMVHDVRVIRMNADHAPKTVRKWLGDSVGRWDGDTLVVDTTNFSDKTRFRGSSENLHVVERFTRTGPKTLRYQFTIDDPSTWTRPWTAEYTWPATDGRIYEYACHEGNYALGNILRGARQKERDEANKTRK